MRRMVAVLVLLCACAGAAGKAEPDAASDADAASDGGDAAPADAGCAQACPVGGRCVDGRCYDPPAVVVPAAQTSCDIAVDGTTIYWANTDLGTVGAGAMTFGAISAEIRPRAIVAHAGRAYWLAGGGGSTAAAATTIRFSDFGYYASTLVAPPDGVGGFAVTPDGRFVYFSTANRVERIEVPGVGAGAVDAGVSGVVVATESAGDVIGALALDGPKLVAAVAGRFVDVFDLESGQAAGCTDTAVDADAGAPVSCVRVARGPVTALAVDQGKVYWTDADLVRSNELVAGGAAATLAVFDTSITGLSLAGGNLFFALGSAVMRLSTQPGAAPVVLADDGARVFSVVSDTSGVYWSSGECTIFGSPP